MRDIIHLSAYLLFPSILIHACLILSFKRWKIHRLLNHSVVLSTGRLCYPSSLLNRCIWISLRCSLLMTLLLVLWRLWVVLYAFHPWRRNGVHVIRRYLSVMKTHLLLISGLLMGSTFFFGSLLRVHQLLRGLRYWLMMVNRLRSLKKVIRLAVNWERMSARLQHLRLLIIAIGSRSWSLSVGGGCTWPKIDLIRVYKILSLTCVAEIPLHGRSRYRLFEILLSNRLLL